MERKKVRFGIIGLGLMGREFGSSAARWCHLLDNGPVPVITGICDTNPEARRWFTENFPTIQIETEDYHDLLKSDQIDAVYCAVPHHLHEKLFCDIINAGKHLLGEKPFGIDKKANDAIVAAAKAHPDLVVRCSSEFPYWPGTKMLTDWVLEKKYGQLMEVHCGFNHSSDMDLSKAINWKRMVDFNGEYGVMGDLGIHTQHIPFRMGWFPKKVYAQLMNIVEERPDGKGGMAPCETWDNATLVCKSDDPSTGKEFSLIMETKRMDPGQTNTWFIEVYGTKGSARFTTHDPKAFYYLETRGKEQGWTRVDIGPKTYLNHITGGIFEFGFSDGFLHMLGAYMQEFRDGGNTHPFPCVTPEETALSHRLQTAALESHRTGRAVEP